MNDPAEALQRALWETLTADAGMIAAFAGEPRVWDTVPRDGNGQPEGGYPYLTIGEIQVIGWEATEQVDESEAYATVNFWDKPEDGSGRERVISLSAIARAALIEPDGFAVLQAKAAAHGFNVVLGERRDARHLEPVDGVERVRATFRFEIDPQPD